MNLIVGGMQYPPRTALDLLSLKDALPEKQRKLRGLIERLSSANSIRTDLQLAAEMMDALEEALRDAERAGTEGRSWLETAALASFNSAIILYVRATKTSSKHRRPLGFLERFSEEQLQVHAHLCSLRDDAIAHYEPGKTLEGQTWHSEAIFVPLDRREDLRIMTASRRLVWQRQLQDLTKRQIRAALEIAEAETLKRNSAVVGELNTMIGDTEFMASTTRHHVDLATFFLSEEEADKVLSNRRGRRSGVIEH